MCPRFPSNLPSPLLTLTLVSDNLLDTLLTDVDTPLFALETEGNITTLSRCGPVHGHVSGPDQLSASIEWPLAQPSSPKSKEPVATVSIDGRTEPSDSLLKKSIITNSRKFQFPGSSGSLKWKRVGDHYECTLCSLACTFHTAVATLLPSTPTVPGELSVFTPALNADPRQPQHSGVSLRLLEYLIITSVLLTTAHDDWRRFPNAPDFSSSPRSLRQRLSSPPSSPTTTIIASPMRRKLDLLEGDFEPFYPLSPSPTSPHHTTRSTLSHSRSFNHLRSTSTRQLTPFCTPPSTPPIAYHELPALSLPVRPLPTVPSTPTSPSSSFSAEMRRGSLPHIHAVPMLHVAAAAPQYSQHPMGRSQSLTSQSRTREVPPVPPIPQHLLAPPCSPLLSPHSHSHSHSHSRHSHSLLSPPDPEPEEPPPSYAEIEWTIKVPQRRREREREQIYLFG